MDLLQQALKVFYPARMSFSKLTGVGKNITKNEDNKTAPDSFHALEAVANNGESIFFEQFRGKHILIVNLASNCGFTSQYEELETLYQQQKDKLVVLGFPSNDFGGQEPGSDAEIADFCTANFGVSFFLFKKDHVKGAGQQPVYQWLSHAGKNGWNSQPPSWNFCKYLVDDQGVLMHYFSSAVSPLDAEILGKIQEV